jgi:protoporphyrinogen IX oxidase
MAGILYLYRLLIYLIENFDNEENQKLLLVMAHRLYRYITMPAMGITWIAGFGIVLSNPGLIGGWFHVKFLMVLFLTISTIYAKKILKRIEGRETNLPTSKKLRVLNEVPTLLMLIIVGLAVFKPF